MAWLLLTAVALLLISYRADNRPLLIDATVHNAAGPFCDIPFQRRIPPGVRPPIAPIDRTNPDPRGTA